MEELQHDLLPGPALQSSQRGQAVLVRATVRVSPAVVRVLRLRQSAGPQEGAADWGAQHGLAGLGTVNMITARLSWRSSVRAELYNIHIHIIPQYHTTPQHSLTSIEGLLCYLARG